MPWTQPHDTREREADRLAHQAARIDLGRIGPHQPPVIHGGRTPDAGAVADASADVARGLNSNWRRVDPAVRLKAQVAFGRDLGGVRVHDNAQAAASARALDAKAYAVGHDIVFGRGRHEPGSSEGQRLLFHELAHVVQQMSSGRAELARDRTGTGGAVSRVTIDCASNTITFATQRGAFRYSMTHCNVTPGEYDATVSVRPGDVHFDLGTAVASTVNFDFGYEIVAGQPNPSTFFGTQRQVRISAPAPTASGPSELDLPVTFVAVPVGGTALGGVEPGSAGASGLGFPSYPLTVAGMGSHVLANGDFRWLSNANAARRVLSREYWSPLVPGRGFVTLDRLTNTLPRNLAPRIAGELASGGPLSWVVERGFTEAELRSIPDIVRRLNTNGIESLSATELAMLRRAAELHIGAATPGAPFASYSAAGRTAPFLEASSPPRYRVRVEIPRTGALDVSAPNAFNLGEEALTNLEEAEFLVVANQEGRIVSVQRVATSGVEPGFLMRNAGAIRWGGRVLFVAGIGLSAHRIATAAPRDRPIVAAEEVGGQLGGMGGTALAVAGCTFFGVATGGVGLLLCGLGGGILGGMAGSAVSGGIARSMRDSPGGGVVCPSCHAMQRDWERERSTLDLGSFRLGESLLPADSVPVSGRPGVAGAAPLDPASLAAIRRWLEEPTPATR